jgi:hypothetical protein
MKTRYRERLDEDGIHGRATDVFCITTESVTDLSLPDQADVLQEAARRIASVARHVVRDTMTLMPLYRAQKEGER